MRHRVKVKKLNRSQGHYRATIASLAGALIEHKQIKTTLAKAKELRPYIEKLITHAKTDSVHKRRVVYRKLNNRQLIYELFTVIGPKNADRDGGYTRILKLGQRRGDGTEMAIIQLVGFEAFDQTPVKKKAAKKKVEKEEKPLLDLEESKVESEEKAEKSEPKAEKSEIAEEAIAESTIEEAKPEKESEQIKEEAETVAEEAPAAAEKAPEKKEVKAEEKTEETSKPKKKDSATEGKKSKEEK